MSTAACKRQPAALKPRENPPAPQKRSMTVGCALTGSADCNRRPSAFPGQQDSKCCPTMAPIVDDHDLPAMLLGDGSRYRKPHPTRAFLRRKERIKDPAGDPSRDPWAVVR